VKRTVGILVGVLALAAAGYLGNQLWAQQYQPQPGAQPQMAPPVTRIALINIGQVMRNYNKFKMIQSELQAEQLRYKKPMEEMGAEATKLQAEANNPQTLQARREQIAHQLKELQRRMQDLEDEAKNKLSKLQYDRMVQTYREVKDAVALYARPRNIELVLHYNDGIGEDAYQPSFFTRRMANGACMPIYNHPGMDITQDIVNTLNARMASNTAPSMPAHN
jgi:Skp family chaperone for outer membrane proteins